VGGQHRQPAALQVGADQAGDDLDRRLVERHVGLIEDPQRASLMHQPGKRGASLLPLRQIAAGEILAAAQPDLFERVDRCVLVECFLRQLRRREQVFERRQFLLDRVVVAEVAEFAAEFLAELADRLAGASGSRRSPLASGRTACAAGWSFPSRSCPAGRAFRRPRDGS
jgi:hypothetical protein